MTNQKLLSRGKEQLNNAGIAEYDLDAWYLFSHVTGLSKQAYFMAMQDETKPGIEELYASLIERRINREPIQYIIGQQEFCGLKFFVNRHVLIPRADTETLVEEALKVIPKGGHVLDLCTGSGCILLSLIHLGQGISGVGVDISEEALDVALENAHTLGLDKAGFIHSNLFDRVNEKFSTIVSNPPYIPTRVIDELEPEVKDNEPHLALDGSSDGLYFYRKIVEQSPTYLTDGGYLLFEIGYDQGEAVSELMQKAGFKEVEVIKDLSGNDRVVKGHL